VQRITIEAKHAAATSAAFLQDYAAVLRETGLISKIGLFVLHREEVAGNSTLETSAGDRALKVNATNLVEQEDMLIRMVLYTAGQKQMGVCGHAACGHCGHK